MKLVLSGALFVQMAAGAVGAQTFKDLQIELGTYTVTDNGGEKAQNMWLSTGPITIGRSTVGTISVSDTCDATAISSQRGDVRKNATAAWDIEVTPTRVVRDAVTFRLHWIRLEGLRRQREEDIELTLRPGESWPLDSASMPPGAKTIDGRTCRGNSTAIRVLVDHYPSEEFGERRVVAADLWLVERVATGNEVQRSEPLSVRGLPNRAVPFYFDRISESNAALDIYGRLTAKPEKDATSVAIELNSRWGESFQRSVDLSVRMNAAEIVELKLPKLGADGGPFANREFAIRIRTRQIR